MSLDPQVLRKLRAGVLSVALHVGLLLVILSGGRYDGMPAGEVQDSILVLLDAPEADSSDSLEPRPPAPMVVPLASDEQLHAAIAKLALPPADIFTAAPSETTPLNEPTTDEIEPIPISSQEVPATFTLSDAETTELSRRLERLAADSIEASRTEVNWEHQGKQYSALLIREPANDGTALERVIAQVRASDRGQHLTTLVNLRRLAFSQFTQIVDSWNPMVQLHDDEIVGRFHSNSRVNLLYDSSAGPQFFGKVTTAARGFNTDIQARRRDAARFRSGMETRTARIELPESPQPFRWASMDENARIHEFASDTSIRFFRDGSYSSRTRRSLEPERHHEPSEFPVYFVAASNVELYVQGVVAGKVLIYSPLRIVIEGSLTYANDPRENPDSGDYAGLVSNKYVEVAPPSVTGPGDLEIDAAIFAGRRFVVTSLDHHRTATLRIYGSLTAGSLTATEPRFATKIEYDSRFERQRPPGFPSTNRYEVSNWDGQWAEVPSRNVGDSP